MQLVLELLKKIFVALSGIYTKQETDSALATKADATALEAEATARQEADTALGERVDMRLDEHDAEIDWLKTAVDGDWKTYMLARAKLTGIQKNIDLVNRAIKEHAANATANLPKRLIEDWSNLYAGYESWLLMAGEESPLDVGFWRAYFDTLRAWEKNPEGESWSVTTNPDGTYSSNCPYFDNEAEYVIDLSVTSARGAGTAKRLLLGSPNKLVVYIPNATSVSYLYAGIETKMIASITPKASTLANLYVNSKAEKISAYAPVATAATYSCASDSMLVRFSAALDKSTTLNGFFANANAAVARLEEVNLFVPMAENMVLQSTYSPKLARLVLHGGAPRATTIKTMLGLVAPYESNTPVVLSFGREWQGELSFPLATDGTTFASYRRGFNQVIAFPSLHTGDDMFLEAGMSAENISAVLDSLPSDPVGAGGTGVITFTGCPGAAELTQESASVAAATARGWTVEL